MFKELICPDCEGSLQTIVNIVCECYAVLEVVFDDGGNPKDYRFLEINEAFGKIIGIKNEEVTGRTVKEIYHDQWAFWMEAYEKVTLAGTPVNIEYYIAETGRYFRVGIFSPQKGKFITLFIDITELKRSEEMLKKHKLLFECAQDAVLYVKNDGGIVDANKAASELYGYSYEELLGLSIHDIRHKSIRSQFNQQMKEADKSGIMFESIHVRKDGSAFHTEVSARGTIIGTDRVRIHIIRDITERINNEERIIYLANHDALTGIPNRACLMNELDRIMEYADRGSHKLALMLFDIDGFKAINDIHGHHAGDEVLKSVASRIREVIRKVDILGRLGGDEFVIIMPMVRDNDTVLKLAERIFKTLDKPICVNENCIKVNISLGISIYPDDAADKEDMLKHADSAMYMAKKQKGNSCCFYKEAASQDGRGEA